MLFTAHYDWFAWQLPMFYQFLSLSLPLSLCLLLFTLFKNSIKLQLLPGKIRVCLSSIVCLCFCPPLNDPIGISYITYPSFFIWFHFPNELHDNLFQFNAIFIPNYLDIKKNYESLLNGFALHIIMSSLTLEGSLCTSVSVCVSIIMNAISKMMILILIEWT